MIFGRKSTWLLNSALLLVLALCFMSLAGAVETFRVKEKTSSVRCESFPSSSFVSMTADPEVWIRSQFPDYDDVMDMHAEQLKDWPTDEKLSGNVRASTGSVEASCGYIEPSGHTKYLTSRLGAADPMYFPLQLVGPMQFLQPFGIPAEHLNMLVQYHTAVFDREFPPGSADQYMRRLWAGQIVGDFVRTHPWDVSSEHLAEMISVQVDVFTSKS